MADRVVNNQSLTYSYFVCLMCVNKYDTVDLEAAFNQINHWNPSAKAVLLLNAPSAFRMCFTFICLQFYSVSAQNVCSCHSPNMSKNLMTNTSLHAKPIVVRRRETSRIRSHTNDCGCHVW